MQARRPRVIIHIGRNKAGSTTIQDYCIAAHDGLARQGIDYLLFGHLWDSRPGIPGVRLFEELAAHAAAAVDRTTLISNEFLSMWPEAYTRATVRPLSGCDVGILVYLRRCDDWVRSSYAEVTRKGMNRADFDAYFDRLAPASSALGNLAIWAESFGWSSITARVLDSDALVGGNLPDDFSAAIGAERVPVTVLPSNRAPHWCELELVRALTERDSDEEWGGASYEAVAPLAGLIAGLARDVPPAEYLSRSQRERLRAVWAMDLETIGRRTGTALPSGRIEPPAERAWLPSISRIPGAVMTDFFAAAASGDFAARHPAAAHRAALLAQRWTTVG